MRIAILTALLGLAPLPGCSEKPSRHPSVDLAPLLDRGQPAADLPPGEGQPLDAAQPDTSPQPDVAQPDLTPPNSELLLYDGDNLQFTDADKGFHPLIQPGDPLPASNWASPRDYYDGELRVRYVIKSPANQAAGQIQTCIWTMGNADGDGKDYFPESCSDQVPFSGTGEIFNAKLVPSTWWKNAGVPLVYSHPERFLIRTVLRGPSGCNVTTYNVTGACWNLWPDYQNMKFRVTLVMVAKGDTFSGWTSYP